MYIYIYIERERERELWMRLNSMRDHVGHTTTLLGAPGAPGSRSRFEPCI